MKFKLKSKYENFFTIRLISLHADLVNLSYRTRNTYYALSGRVILMSGRSISLQQCLETLDILDSVPQYLHFR